MVTSKACFGAVFFASIGVFVAACSSTTNIVNPSCGAGTTLVDGTCVAVTADSSAPGEDASEDVAMADTTVAEDSSEPIDSITIVDAAVDSSKKDAASDSAEVGGFSCADLDANCSKTCGGPSAECMTALTGCYVRMRANCVGKTRCVLRLPESPFLPTCAECKGSITGRVDWSIVVDDPSWWKVTIPEPWANSYGCGQSPITKCRMVSVSGGGGTIGYVILTTTATSVPATDLVLEKVAWGSTCP